MRRVATLCRAKRAADLVAGRIGTRLTWWHAYLVTFGTAMMAGVSSFVVGSLRSKFDVVKPAL